MTLDGDQRAIVAIRLRLLEENLTEIERLADHDEEGVLYRRARPRLSAEERAAMAELITSLRTRIASLADAFDLQHEEQNATRRISALLSLSWESVLELAPTRLSGYGAVDPRAARTLDAETQELASLVLALQKTVVRLKSGETPSSGDAGSNS